MTQLTRQQILALEPNLNPSLCGGILIPDEAVIDSWLLPALMAHLAVETGNCEVNYLNDNYVLVKGKIAIYTCFIRPLGWNH